MILLNSIIGVFLFFTNCLLLLGLKKFFKLAQKNNKNPININNNKGGYRK